MVSYYDEEKDVIVFIIDSEPFLKNPNKVFAHELAHREITKRIPKWFKKIWPLYFLFYLYIEEPYVYFYGWKKQI